MNTMACTKVAHCSPWRLGGDFGAGAASQRPGNPWGSCIPLVPMRLFFSRIESLSSKLDALTRFSAPLLLRPQHLDIACAFGTRLLLRPIAGKSYVAEFVM